MTEFVSRIQWRLVKVGDKQVSLPAMVSRVLREVRGSKFNYWRIFTRVDGKNYHHNFRIRDLDTPPLIEALQGLIFLIETVGLPNRLHAKRRVGLKGSLPVGVTGPHTREGRTFFRVSFSESGLRSVDRKIFVEGSMTKTEARKEAVNLRRQAIEAYQKANQNDATLVVARLWQLIKELNE